MIGASLLIQQKKNLATTRAHFPFSLQRLGFIPFIVEIKGIIEMQHLKNTPTTYVQNTQ